MLLTPHSWILVATLLLATCLICQSFPSKKLENGLLLGYILARKNPPFMPL